jgi:hypothetical protein
VLIAKTLRSLIRTTECVDEKNQKPADAACGASTVPSLALDAGPQCGQVGVSLAGKSSSSCCTNEV